ncbi:HMCN1-like protein, partial [Mya arenaria]
DGHWSIWEIWGGCDVTCGKGIKSRSRTCNNPPAAGGGFDCVGNTVETDVCSLETCPVHGGWSGWSGWGICSSSCGAGLQRRDRSCDNPWPSKDGNHCFGDSVDNRICQENSCASKNIGFLKRCLVFKHASGISIPNNSYMFICVHEHLQTNVTIHGGWNGWSEWETCSSSCGAGLQRRDRSCDNPWPLKDWNHCFGDSVDYRICQEMHCA